MSGPPPPLQSVPSMSQPSSPGNLQTKLSAANLKALNSPMANLPGVCQNVPEKVQKICGPGAVKAGVVFYGACERETTSMMKSRKKILVMCTRAAVVFCALDTGEVLRMFRYGEILSPLTVCCQQLTPTLMGVTSVLIKVGAEQDALVHFDGETATADKYKKFNDPAWSSPERFVTCLKAYHDHYVTASPLNLVQAAPKTQLKKAASLKSPLRDKKNPEEVMGTLQKKLVASPLPPAVEGSEGMPGSGTPDPNFDASATFNSGSPQGGGEGKPLERGKSVTFNTANENNALAGENSNAEALASLTEQQQQEAQAQQEASQSQFAGMNTACDTDGPDPVLVKQLRMEIANLKSERDSYKMENSRLTYELEEMQYDMVKPGEVDAVQEAISAGAGGATFGEFMNTLVTSDHTVEDFNRMAAQLLQVQKQLQEERENRGELVKQEVEKMERTYDAVVLTQQEEISALRNQVTEMEVVFQRLRSGIDGSNTHAMLHSFHGNSFSSPNTTAAAGGRKSGANFSNSASPARSLNGTHATMNNTSTLLAGQTASRFKVASDQPGGGGATHLPQGYSPATRTPGRTVDSIGQIPSTQYVTTSSPSSIRMQQQQRQRANEPSSTSLHGINTQNSTIEHSNLFLQPDLAPGSRAVQNRLKLDV